MNTIKFRKDSDLLNNTFKTILNTPLFHNWENLNPAFNYSPKVKISEDRNRFLINLELPGLTKEDVKLSVENYVLTVSGTKKQETKNEDTKIVLNEIYYGDFSRTFNLSKDIKIEDTDAEFKDGILNITLPKVEEAKPVIKEINIK
ncbi:MAG: Hsp20/alpha crystallin family protein [Bacteroidota bacterium]|nr:Hsp20/alpha crystallin family protein [Bacteroidota bacterium]